MTGRAQGADVRDPTCSPQLSSKKPAIANYQPGVEPADITTNTRIVVD